MKIRQSALFLMVAASMIGCSKDKDNEKDQVENQAEIFMNTFNSRDPDKLASLFETDSILCSMSDGVKIPGKIQIERYFKNEFKNEKDFKANINISDLKVNDDHTARVLYTSDSNGQKKIIKAEYALENGKWLLKRVVIVEDRVPISHYEELKDLSFLIGTWVDEDEDVDMDSNFEWGKNKNSIIQNVDLRLLGVKQVKGRQIITWDPVRKKIRSWVFDSDGGFGVCSWTKKDGSWYVRKVFISPEGSKITETDVYTQTSDNTYTQASINREVNGKPSPSIGAFKVVKKK